MRDIEDEAAPALSALVHNRTLELSTEDRASLAAWLALKIMLFQYAKSPSNDVRAAWLQRIYRDHLPPETWWIWITAYSGYKPFHYEDRPVDLYPTATASPSPEGEPTGVLASLIVGSLAAKVLGVTRGVLDHPVLPHLYRLWPLTATAPEWPPQFHISDQTMVPFVGMWLPEPPAIRDWLPDR